MVPSGVEIYGFVEQFLVAKKEKFNKPRGLFKLLANFLIEKRFAGVSSTPRAFFLELQFRTFENSKELL